MRAIPSRRPLCAFVMLLAFTTALAETAAAPAGQEPMFSRPAGPVLELVRDDDAFLSFARRLSVEADRMLLAETAGMAETITPEQRKRLLGLRVHLALCLGQDEIASDAADRLREFQTDPGERAHSGLLTRALIESRRDPVALERTLRALLDALPRDPSVRAAVARSATRIAAMSETALIAEIRDGVAPKLARGEPCTLEIADGIVRAGHRLRNILPLRAALLRAYEAALANWR